MARDGEGRQALTVLVAGDDASQRSKVRATLLALEEPLLAVVEEGVEGDVEADVAMVIVGENKEAALARLEAHARRRPRPAVFALLSEPSEPLIRRTLNAGADEVLLFEPPQPQAWMRALLKVDERRAAQRKGRGAIVSLASVTGGAA